MKKFVLLIMIFLLLLGVSGCMSANFSMGNERKKLETIENYLSEKYQVSFAFVSQGDAVWSSRTKYFVYRDEMGNEFTVKDNNGSFTDNYSSALFDVQIQSMVTSALGEDVKAYVNTNSVFFGKDKLFVDYAEYARSCPIVNVVVYVIDEEVYEEIANKILHAMEGCSVSVVVYCVDAENFKDVTKYDDSSLAISSESFLIVESQVNYASWEE